MSTLVVAVATAVGAGALGLGTRPGPRRTPAVSSVPTRVARSGLATWIGRSCRRLVGRGADPRRDRRTGRCVIAAAVGAPFGIVVSFALTVAVYALDVRRRHQDARRAVEAVRDELPDVVDLLVTAVGAGLSVTTALGAVADLTDGPVARGLRGVTRGHVDVVTALGALPEQVGEPVRPLVRVLTDGLRHGVPVGPGLERLAADGRADRRRRAETRARQTSVRLVFPLVVCLLPAFALLTVAPVLLSSLTVFDG